MGNVRFTQVVEHSGRPEVYLILSDPKHDSHFQAVLKANRLMTVQHGGTGSKASFGRVGYFPEAKGEVLVFPRSLRSFADDRVVGINFDLLEQEREAVEEEAEMPKVMPKPKLVREEKEEEKRGEKKEETPEEKPAKASPKAEAPARRKGKGKRAKAEDHPELALEREAPRPPAKVISFHGHEAREEKEEEGEEAAEVAALKKEVRRALKALEGGKQVVAFNILKALLK